MQARITGDLLLCFSRLGRIPVWIRQRCKDAVRIASMHMRSHVDVMINRALELESAELLDRSISNSALRN